MLRPSAAGGAPVLFKEEFARVPSRGDHPLAISNAVCKPQARDKVMTAA